VNKYVDSVDNFLFFVDKLNLDGLKILLIVDNLLRFFKIVEIVHTLKDLGILKII
jgi:hypothetical protein